MYVNISGGTSYIYTTDDGMNAAGGSDSSGGGGSWGQQSSTGTLTISGGYNYVNSLGDGLDSNGSIYITGGFTVVGETGNGNGVPGSAVVLQQKCTNKTNVIVAGLVLIPAGHFLWSACKRRSTIYRCSHTHQIKAEIS